MILFCDLQYEVEQQRSWMRDASDAIRRRRATRGTVDAFGTSARTLSRALIAPATAVKGSRRRSRGFRVVKANSERADANDMVGATSDEKRRAKMDALAGEFESKFECEYITAKEVMARMGGAERRVVLVDVRGEEERATSVIAGAMSAEEYESARAGLGPHDCVCYCTIGYRSGQYAEKMSKSATDANAKYYNLYGSILAWTHEGGELVDPKTGKSTKKVHTFGKQWACAANGYDEVYFKNPVMKGLGQMVRGWFGKKK